MSNTPPTLARLLDGRVDPGRPLLLFSLTPPRQTITTDRLERLASATTERLNRLAPDAVVLYDIEDESDRNPEERPFPFLATMDPAHFRREHLSGWGGPTIIYRSVGKYQPAELSQWMADEPDAPTATVLVGASSSDKQIALGLSQAHQLWRTAGSPLPLGGVMIPERHASRGDEHERMLRKQQAGCSFFVSQVVYDLDAAKDLISDYHYTGVDRETEAAPLIFTLSVCGSLKTLDFLQWLGVQLPRWAINELEHTDDPLSESHRQCMVIAEELARFCHRLGVPFGFNIESVSNRKVEIDASVRLAEAVSELVRPAPGR